MWAEIKKEKERVLSTVGERGFGVTLRWLSSNPWENLGQEYRI